MEIRRLMTVPGVNVIVAATFLAAIGEICRFESPRKLVGYLGLVLWASQSGSAPATHGRISKQGSTRARHALVEASWLTVRQPGPVRAFYERIRARRGHQVAIVACARSSWSFLVPAQPLAGLRLRAAVVDAEEAPPARACRRRPKQARDEERPMAGNAATAAKAERAEALLGRLRPPTDAASATGRRPRQRERAPARHRGAHLVGRQAAKQRGRSKPPRPKRAIPIIYRHPGLRAWLESHPPAGGSREGLT